MTGKSLQLDDKVALDGYGLLLSVPFHNIIANLFATSSTKKIMSSLVFCHKWPILLPRYAYYLSDNTYAFLMSDVDAGFDKPKTE